MPTGAVALDGYCPVCRIDKGAWVAGSAQHQVPFDGKVYRFPGPEAAAAFRADPTRYAPALGGDDLVEYARSGRRVPGKTAFGAKYLGRLYFFASEANKEAFRADPSRYAEADLALGGACVVCRIDRQQVMTGDPRFTAIHEGLRYQFAGAQQLQQFRSMPGRYAAQAPPAGSGSRPPAGSGGNGSGRR